METNQKQVKLKKKQIQRLSSSVNSAFNLQRNGPIQQMSHQDNKLESPEFSRREAIKDINKRKKSQLQIDYEYIDKDEYIEQDESFFDKYVLGKNQTLNIAKEDLNIDHNQNLENVQEQQDPVNSLRSAFTNSGYYFEEGINQSPQTNFLRNVSFQSQSLVSNDSYIKKYEQISQDYFQFNIEKKDENQNMMKLQKHNSMKESIINFKLEQISQLEQDTANINQTNEQKAQMSQKKKKNGIFKKLINKMFKAQKLEKVIQGEVNVKAEEEEKYACCNNFMNKLDEHYINLTTQEDISDCQEVIDTIQKVCQYHNCISENKYKPLNQILQNTQKVYSLEEIISIQKQAKNNFQIFLKQDFSDIKRKQVFPTQSLAVQNEYLSNKIDHRFFTEIDQQNSPIGNKEIEKSQFSTRQNTFVDCPINSDFYLEKEFFIRLFNYIKLTKDIEFLKNELEQLQDFELYPNQDDQIIKQKMILLQDCIEKRDQQFQMNKLHENIHRGLSQLNQKNHSTITQQLNIRSIIWPIICKTESLKEEFVLEFNSKNKGKFLNSPQSVYEYYRDQRSDNITNILLNDIVRCGDRCQDVSIDIESKENILFNILNAYAHYDPDVGYCQGMNCLVFFIIQSMQKQEFQNMHDKYNELDCFFILIHIMKKLGWSEVYEVGFKKLISLLLLLNQIMHTEKYQDIWKHIIEVFDGSMSDEQIQQIMFTPSINSIFRCHLNGNSTLKEHQLHIFDMYLIKGEIFIIETILQSLIAQKDKILNMDDELQLKVYLQKEMYVDTFQQIRCCHQFDN